MPSCHISFSADLLRHSCETTGGLLEELHPIMKHTFLRAALLFVHASGRNFKIRAFSVQPGPETLTDCAYFCRFLQCSWYNHCWGCQGGKGGVCYLHDISRTQRGAIPGPDMELQQDHQHHNLHQH